MGFSFRKSFKLGPARVNLSKSGVGFSVGAGGVRYTKSPKRKTKHKDSTSKANASKQSAGMSHQEPAPKLQELLTRNWFNAIFLAVVGFVITAVVSFLAVLLLCVIISIFVRGFLSTIGANILIFGLPLILAALAARFAFLQYRPLKEDSPGPAIQNAEENQKANTKSGTETREYEVAGVEFYLKNLLSMMEPNYLYSYKKQELIDTCNYDVPIYKTTCNATKLELVQEDDNPQDPNAVLVLLDQKIVGYISRNECEHVRYLMDNDLIVSFTCQVYGGKYKQVNEDYNWEKDRSTYSMESGEDDYGITVRIEEKVV